jgi:hypothetical protein
MMRIENRYMIIIALVGVLFTLPTKGFGPIGHCYCSPTEPRSLWLLPDMWQSWEGKLAFDPIAIGVSFRVSKEFAWSHACMKRGVVGATPIEEIIHAITYTWIGFTVPEQPGNYDSTIAPEADMYYLCRDKLSTEHVDPEWLGVMLNTVRGFAYHNVEDAVVHWGYFKAGTPSNWVFEHYFKEPWVEYAVFVKAGGTWEDGIPVPPDRLANMGDMGDGCIINLAQKVSRKNRVKVTYDGYAEEKMDVQDAATILSAMASQYDEVAGYIDELDQVSWASYQLLAGARSWTSADLNDMLSDATDSAASIAMP